MKLPYSNRTNTALTFVRDSSQFRILIELTGIIIIIIIK